MKEYYTVNEIAKMLNLSRQTIIRYIKAGRMNAVKFSRYYMIPQEELDRFLVISELKAKGLTTKQAERYLQLAKEEVTRKEDTMEDLLHDILRVNVNKQQEEYRNDKSFN